MIYYSQAPNNAPLYVTVNLIQSIAMAADETPRIISVPINTRTLKAISLEIIILDNGMNKNLYRSSANITLNIRRKTMPTLQIQAIIKEGFLCKNK